MADQTVKIENDDVASTAYFMAQNLWINQYSKSPKATEAKFMALTSVCVMTLQGRLNREQAESNITKLFAN